MAVSISGNFTSAAEAINVEMAEIKISTRLTDKLTAYGLGACIGVCLYDPSRRIAALAHVVLPEQPKSMSTSSKPGMRDVLAGKFADTAIPALISEICRGGAIQENLRAAIAGGAHIFSTLGPSTTASRLEIGARNAAAVTFALEDLGIPIFACDVGGSHGRTLSIRSCDGYVTIRPIGGVETPLASLGKTHEVAA